MRWPMAGVAVLCLAAVAGGQDYELVRPDGLVTSTVRVVRGRLIVTQPSGERFVYLREPRYDSPDGGYAGYVNPELNRVVRFPREGRGSVQTADLDDANPRFRFSSSQVRVAGSDRFPAGPVAPPGPPIPVAPGGLYPSLDPYAAVDPYSAGFGSGYADPYGYGGGPAWGVPAYPLPQSVLIDSQFTPAPPLAPVQVELFNGSRRPLQVGLIQLEKPGVPAQSFSIPPGRSRVVELQRDAGGTEIRTYRTISPYGDAVTKRVERAVPPEILYELVVHEWAMQSVAIDRTGKSPNVIEDVNYQGKGIGRFQLPAGERLQSQRIDVFAAAVQSGMAATVPPILAAEDATDQPLPLERAVLEAQRRAQQGR